MGTVARHIEGADTLNVLFHGQTASIADWTEFGGYTKGGDLTRLIEEHGQSWIACDHYGHGDHLADEPGFDNEDLSDEIWDKFLERSASAFRAALDEALAQRSYERLNIVTYSLGSLVALQLAKGGLPLPVGTILMAVPATERDYDDETSLHNNLAIYEAPLVSIAVALDDEELDPNDIVWFYGLIGGEKRMRTYQSGHSLPVEWVRDVIGDLVSANGQGY